MLWDAIPTKATIAERMRHREDADLKCVLCNEDVESSHHLVIGCMVSRIIWRHSPWALDIMVFSNKPLLEWLMIILNPSLLHGLSVVDHHRFQLDALIVWDLV